ncbi:hypothetical protein [Pseudomonas sp. Irchel 3A7]|uniref:hypothetical protein n=1 Tax=Pseudomonas sp. Irchel 3A7 TaxID=2008913 RepID=UPI000BA40CAA|nr:hypothetical protein [Pseudomonas sp. Irchel 3A7]
MQVTINNMVEFSEVFRNGDEFIQHFFLEGPEELTSNRQFALETILLSGVLFIIGQAVAAYYRKSAAVAAKQRHDEVLAKLEELARNPNVQLLRDALETSNITVVVEVSQAEDVLLSTSLTSIENQIPSVRFIRFAAEGAEIPGEDEKPL